MLAPSLFNSNYDLFDPFTQDPWFRNPWFDFGGREFNNMEKKLYGHRAKNVMNTDITESDAAYEMTVDLPGFKKENVNVSLENGYLTISAAKGFENNEAENEEDRKNGKYIRRERYSGSCQRSFYVGENLKTEDIKAKFEHGILSLNIPKKQPEEVAENKYIAIEG